jgi:hypothetical protein
MKTIPVDTRAFHFKLRPKKYRKPPEKVGMTAEQMRVFSKFHEAAIRAFDNLACVLGEPSVDQAEELDELLDQLPIGLKRSATVFRGGGEGLNG